MVKAMSKGNEPAFPTEQFHNGNDQVPPFYALIGGLTTRELFAAMMMQGLVSVPVSGFEAGKRASEAVTCADALLDALAKDGGDRG